MKTMWPLLLALTSFMPVSFGNNATWDLPKPTNVIIDSYNMKHILRWDPVSGPYTPIPVMYRVECELYSHSLPMCVNITETQCDFTGKIKPFWRANYKVRAELGGWRSAWAEVRQFQGNINTTIGPVRALVLKSHGNSMSVDFLPPFPPISDTFRFKYLLYYWKEGAEYKMEVPLKLTHHILDDLEELTMYCVQVQASTERIEGQKSDPKCADTASRVYTGKELAVIVIVCIVVCGICSVVGYLIYRNRTLLKRFLYPPFRMPYHIQEFLDNPPEQPYEVAFDRSHTEDDYDNVSIIDLTFFPEGNLMSADPNLVPAEKT